MQEMDANCGVVTNPLANLGSNMGEMDQLTGDARSYQAEMQGHHMHMMDQLGGPMPGQQAPMFEQPVTLHMPQMMSFTPENISAFAPQQQFEPAPFEQQFGDMSLKEQQVNLEDLYSAPMQQQQQMQPGFNMTDPYMAQGMMPMMPMMPMQMPMMPMQNFMQQPAMPFDQSLEEPIAQEPIAEDLKVMQ